MLLFFILAAAGVVCAATANIDTDVITLSKTLPANASVPVLEAFMSYSIEFSSFPDFAGNNSSPNLFSNNLLENIGAFIGTKPYIRVGGNTQDYALYNASLETATFGIVNPRRSLDYPTTLFIGPSYFESYNTWPCTKFVHGFNLGLGGNSSAGWETLIETVPLACRALGADKLLWWEYGNEPDLYSTSAQGPVRPPSWNESTYVSQWLNGTNAIKATLSQACPSMISQHKYGYYAPSFAGTSNHLKPVTAWQAGLDTSHDIKIYSIHNYIGGANQPGITLQGTLMNHASNVNAVGKLIAVKDALFLRKSGSPEKNHIPFILGETNSLYNEGKPGLSNTFGAALWGFDFALYCASQGIQRIHMHQGTSYRYASWQPITTNETSIGTKPPYYGNIAVAAFLGDLTTGLNVSIVNLPLGNDSHQAAYAAYVGGHLVRVAVVNLDQYNYTVNGTSSVLNPVPRPLRSYEFKVPGWSGRGKVQVRRLLANGSDALSGVTWDGWSYNYELNHGQPVRLDNITVGEEIVVIDGVVSLDVLDSSAAVLDL